MSPANTVARRTDNAEGTESRTIPGTAYRACVINANYISIVESTHDIQNPVSIDKLHLVADYLGAGTGDRVLDIGSGRGWWAVELAQAGAEVTCLEINEDFVAATRQRADDAGVADRVHTVLGPAEDFDLEPDSYDVVTCLGASFALDGYRPALDWIARAVRSGGRIAIGDVHAVEAEDVSDELPSLGELSHVAEGVGFDLVGLVSASLDDWDRYESRHWANIAAWAAQNPDHPKRDDMLIASRRYRNDYLTSERGRIGWSILVAAMQRESARG